MVLRIDVRLERVVCVAERRQREGLGLGQSRAAAQHAGSAGEGGGAGQELQGIPSVHDFLRGRFRWDRAMARGARQCYTVRVRPDMARRRRGVVIRAGCGWRMPRSSPDEHQISVSDASRSTQQAPDPPRHSHGRAGLVPSRARAQDLIRRGLVEVGGVVETRPRRPRRRRRRDRPVCGAVAATRLARRPEADRRARSFPLSRDRPRRARHRRVDRRLHAGRCSTAARRASMRSMSVTASCTRGWPPTRASSRSRTATRAGSIARSCRSPSARSSPT